jgi:hypothetical protein
VPSKRAWVDNEDNVSAVFLPILLLAVHHYNYSSISSPNFKNNNALYLSDLTVNIFFNNMGFSYWNNETIHTATVVG